MLAPGMIEAFGLYAVRSSALVVSAPLLGSGTRFEAYKVALILSIAVTMYTVGERVIAPVEPLIYGALALREALIGLFLGYVLHLALLVIKVAGELIGHEMGFMIASQVDPATGLQTPLITSVYETMFLLTLLACDGHFLLLRALAASFDLAPIGILAFDQGFGALAGELFGDMFEAGLVFAAPIMALLFLVSLMMGLLSRAVPHLNVLELGFAVRILFALIVMYAFTPLLGPSIQRIFQAYQDALESALGAL